MKARFWTSKCRKIVGMTDNINDYYSFMKCRISAIDDYEKTYYMGWFETRTRYK